VNERDQQELRLAGDDLFASSQPEAEGSLLPRVTCRDPGVITDGPLKQLMDRNFIRYAAYVIRDRAIPDLDDGLKPVQRRILHSLHLNDDGRFIKVANIVGYSMQFHPHGDASIGEALVGLANRQYLIEGQGNFGNVLTGDPAAAPRYIECRLTELARTEVFNEALTDFVPSYDGRRQEPVSLPVKVPLLLMMGAEGIAVGISTRILPHNFCELIEAQIAILNKKPVTVLPDFQQGGLMDASAYDEGRGVVKLRARIEKRDESTLVVRELPFGTTTDSLIASVEEAARKGKVRVQSIQDFTSEQVEIAIGLQPEQDPAKAIDALYAFTQCQVQLSSRLVVIREGRPVEMDVGSILKHNTDRLLQILRKELMLNQRQIRESLHRLMLVEIFIGNRLYKLLEECDSTEMAERIVADALAAYGDRLQRDITHADLVMLLDLPMRRITRYDIEKGRREQARLREELTDTEKNLSELVAHAVRYLRQILRKYGPQYPRRCELARFDQIEVRELTANDLKIGYDREKGYLGFKVAGEILLECSPLDRLQLVWRDGRMRIVPPPEKLYVDSKLMDCRLLARDRILTVVYREDSLTYIKRFESGGVINRDYQVLPRGAEIVLLADDQPGTLFVVYEREENQKIRQQEFDISALPVRERGKSGTLMTAKPVASVTPVKPRRWDDSLTGPPGKLMSFV
jgi:topoisomerase-4 subunit A